jgi:hypothetical protein
MRSGQWEGSARPTSHPAQASFDGGTCDNQGTIPGVLHRGAGQDLFDAAQRLDLEGIVAKRKVDAYAPGLTGRWELFQKPS